MILMGGVVITRIIKFGLDKNEKAFCIFSSSEF